MNNNISKIIFFYYYKIQYFSLLVDLLYRKKHLHFNKEIDITDIDMNLITQEKFIAFYTGYIEKELYDTKSYFTSHPQLSNELIEQLIDRKISIIGIDSAGVKRGSEHRTTDQYCADRGAFIIENLCNLDKVLNQKKVREFTVNTYPLNFEDMTGLPCRVIAEILYAI